MAGECGGRRDEPKGIEQTAWQRAWERLAGWPLDRLTDNQHDDVRRLAAGLSIVWTQLHDSKSDKLRRYGEIDPALPEALDPDLERLIDLVMRTIRLLEQATR